MKKLKRKVANLHSVVKTINYYFNKEIYETLIVGNNDNRKKQETYMNQYLTVIVKLEKETKANINLKLWHEILYLVLRMKTNLTIPCLREMNQ